MTRNPGPHPATQIRKPLRQALRRLALAAGTCAVSLLAGGLRAAPAVPFGSHALTYASSIFPAAGQAAVETATKAFYNNWKAAYYVTGCGAGQGRINYDGAMQTVSEAHGYGMLIFALMAGYDANAKVNFDAMYQFYKAHPANGGANKLLAWQQDSSCTDINGPDTATDGDLDVAQALLLADRQWGSCGTINYKAEAVAMINQIKQFDCNSTTKYVRLGSWATTGNYATSTRSSDFMPDHYRSYQWATGDAAWGGLTDFTYYLVTATANTTTGLIPDFIINVLTAPGPSTPNFLESANDGDYNWNACRDPWRLATDYLVSGDPRAKAAAQKMATWLKGAPVNGNPAMVRAGYKLPGTQLVNYGDRAFTVPFALAAMVDSSNQALLNSFWANADVSGTGTIDYFGDSIKMLCMIVLSGNWWAPELLPDPCTSTSPTPSRTATLSASSPTASATPTPSRTATLSASSPTASVTPTTTRTATRTATASSTPSATPLASSPTLTATRSSTATATPTATPLVNSPTSTATRTATASATPSATPLASSPTSTATRSATATATPSATPLAGSPTSTDTCTVTTTATPSATPLAGSPTSTGTRTATASVTPSATPLASSPTSTDTATVTATATPSSTPLAGSPTVTVSGTDTRTSTASATPSATPMPGSPTSTGTRSSTATSTPSLTATTTGTPAATATITPASTLSASSTASPTATSTGGTGEGPLVIQHCEPLPNPNASQLALELEGAADQVEVRIYSANLALVACAKTGAVASGWSRVPLPLELKTLAGGTYFYVMSARRGNIQARAHKGVLVLAR